MTNTQQARKRRLQDTLIIAGDAVMAFSAWDLAKVALFLALTDEGRLRELASIDDSVSMPALFAVVGVIVLVDIAVRVYVGMSARAEGRGKKKGSLYLVVAVLAGVVNAFSAITTALGENITLSVMDTVLTVVIEATALAAIVLVVCCAVRLRRLDGASG